MSNGRHKCLSFLYLQNATLLRRPIYVLNPPHSNPKTDSAKPSIATPNTDIVRRWWREKRYGKYVEDVFLSAVRVDVVPKIDGKKVRKQTKEEVKKAFNYKVPLKELRGDDINYETKFRESIPRLQEFEKKMERRKGKSERELRKLEILEQQRRPEYEEVGEDFLGPTDNLVYPRDVVGVKFRKDKVKYKFELYMPVWYS